MEIARKNATTKSEMHFCKSNKLNIKDRKSLKKNICVRKRGTVGREKVMECFPEARSV